MNLKSVFFSLFLISFASNVSAGQVEVGQWIPWSFLSSEIKKLPLNFQSEPANWTLNWQGWNPQALGSQIQVQGGFSDLQITGEGIQAQAQNLSATLKINQLAIDQTIVREVAGNQIQIRVQIQCQPIEIQMSSVSVVAAAAFQKQTDHWAPRLSSLNIDLPQGSWKVGPVNCQGPFGTDQALLLLIQQSLNNPKAFQEIIRAWLTPKIDELWKSSWDLLLAQTWQTLKVKSMGEPGRNGFFLIGQIETVNSQNVVLPALTDTQSESTTPQLVMSTEGFSALAQENLKKFAIQNYDLQQIEAFGSLMHSRFLQFFVWPDLLHYSRNTPFYLSSNPEKTKMTLTPSTAGQWQLQMQTQGVIRAERKGAMRDYLNWGIGMSARLETQVVNSRLLLKTTNSQTQLSSSFDPSYVQTFQPNTRLSASVLDKAGKSLFENRSFETQLPVLNWKGQEWKLNGWKQNGALIWLEWKS
jgi:hypothetical protein